MYNLFLRIEGRRTMKDEIRKVNRRRSKYLWFFFFLESNKKSLSVYKDNNDIIILEKSPQVTV